jgi:hypothetical protein
MVHMMFLDGSGHLDAGRKPWRYVWADAVQDEIHSTGPGHYPTMFQYLFSTLHVGDRYPLQRSNRARISLAGGRAYLHTSFIDPIVLRQRSETVMLTIPNATAHRCWSLFECQQIKAYQLSYPAVPSINSSIPRKGKPTSSSLE